VNGPNPHIVCNTSVTNTAVVNAAAVVNGQNVTLQDSADATVSVSSSNSSGACGSNCATTAKNSSKFFEKCIDKDKYIWFTSVIKLVGQAPSNGVSVQVTNGTITLPGGTSVQVPNGTITFSPNTSQTSTVWVNGMWETTVPLNTQGAVFATGLAYEVPACFCPKGKEEVTWNAPFSSNVPGVEVDWQWSAAVYQGNGQYGPPSQWYGWLGVKSADYQCDTNYRNNDCAGTPEWSKQFLCQGATGLGGKDYCGLRGGSVDVLICPPPPPHCPPPPPPHCHTPEPKPHCPPPTPKCGGGGPASGWNCWPWLCF
jgi:hypothetical protein